MATLQQKIKAELQLRSMVENEGLPEPDHVEYGIDCIRVLWWESKVALVIDFDELGPDVETLEELGLDPADLGAERFDWPDELDRLDYDEADEGDEEAA
jgi:hypothetical protein